MKFKFSYKFILGALLLLAGIFRFYNPAWDQGYHLHPDERFIIMKVIELKFPENISTFLTKESTWNPNFFAYGSFPLYLLNFIGQMGSLFNPMIAGYDLILIAGRITSAIFDLFTVLLVFLIGKKIAGRAAGFFGALIYAAGVLPIQLSHFYAVDTILTFFITAVLYQLILYYEKPDLKKLIRIGILFGLAVATKISAAVLMAPILLIPLREIWVFYKTKHHKNKKAGIINLFKNITGYILPILISAFIVFVITSPYAFIDYEQYIKHTMEQSQMTYNAFVFPYTLQYVGKTTFIFELTNIFLWGLGPVSAIVCFAGFFYFVYLSAVHKKGVVKGHYLLILFFFLVYFWIVGRFSVGFMRYMLPVYPLLSLFGGVFLYAVFRRLIKAGVSRTLIYPVFILYFILLLVWPLSFMHIYTKKNTRVTATEWIKRNIPAGKAIAQEHWDDPVPLYGSEDYRIITLPLYDPDTPEKWMIVNNLLDEADYIVVASNRLYVPLQKLTDCANLPSGRCYPITSLYYKNLFAGERGFQKIAEFSVYPKIPFTQYFIDDQSADESFTVYDHPKVMIFQKIQKSVNP